MSSLRCRTVPIHLVGGADSHHVVMPLHYLGLFFSTQRMGDNQSTSDVLDQLMVNALLFQEQKNRREHGMAGWL